VVPPFLNGCAVFAHKHVLALAHASRGGKCKRRGSPPLERSDERSGGGVAQRRSAQAKRGRLGCLLSRVRDGVPRQAWLPYISVKRRDCFPCWFRILGVGVADRKGAQKCVVEDGTAGWNRVGEVKSAEERADRFVSSR
jgi:hypothetical protein